MFLVPQRPSDDRSSSNVSESVEDGSARCTDLTIRQPHERRAGVRGLARRLRKERSHSTPVACAASRNESVKPPRSAVSILGVADTWPKSFNATCVDGGVSLRRSLRQNGDLCVGSGKHCLALLCADTRQTYDRQAR
jgi:hypothetical protein